MAGRHVRQILQHPQGEHGRKGGSAPTAKVKLAVDHARMKGTGQLRQFARKHVGAENDPQSLRIDGMSLQTGVDVGQIGRREGQLDLAAHHLQAFPRSHVLFRVEIGHHAAERRRQVGGVEQVQWSNTAATFTQRIPERLPPDADRADNTHPSDDTLVLVRHTQRQSRDQISRILPW